MLLLSRQPTMLLFHFRKPIIWQFWYVFKISEGLRKKPAVFFSPKVKCYMDTCLKHSQGPWEHFAAGKKCWVDTHPKEWNDWQLWQCTVPWYWDKPTNWVGVPGFDTHLYCADSGFKFDNMADEFWLRFYRTEGHGATLFKFFLFFLQSLVFPGHHTHASLATNNRPAIFGCCFYFLCVLRDHSKFVSTGPLGSLSGKDRSRLINCSNWSMGTPMPTLIC